MYNENEKSEMSVEAAEVVKTDENAVLSIHTKPERKKRIPLTHRTWAKVIAFILVILSLALSVGSVFAAIFMIDEGVYNTSEREYKNNVFVDIAGLDMRRLIILVDSDQEFNTANSYNYLRKRNIASVEFIFSDDPDDTWKYDGGKTAGEYKYEFIMYHLRNTEYGSDFYSPYPENTHNSECEILRTVDISVTLSETFDAPDEYLFADLLVSVMYAMRYLVYALMVVSVIIAIICFVFLMCASGRRNGLENAQPGWGTRIPFDITVAAAFVASIFLLEIGFEGLYSRSNDFIQVTLLVLTMICVAVIVVGLFMSFALRVKLGGWWKNTVIFYVLRLCWFIVHKIISALNGLGALISKIPLIWKTALITFVVCGFEFIFYIINMYEGDNIFIYWMIRTVILIPLIFYAALMLRRLYKGSQELAGGDLTYQIDTKGMVWDFRASAENLNSIGRGMTIAVNERIRSERMKTELITNVSHDIKTPLTSIINYSDLICNEPVGSEKIPEYAEVLHRQSERLKRLTDDLVEASKASTGNLEMNMEPCELDVLLTQVAGEYMQRMENAGLTLVTQIPDDSVKVLGDGRRLWRVFDNLMNNACKYAMPGTRVYLTLAEKNGEAVIAFKNTSQLPLNISADELMERFVRGDASRNTEGNGLGLSIARSLTELQGGKLSINIDGDFFKAELIFPTIS